MAKELQYGYPKRPDPDPAFVASRVMDPTRLEGRDVGSIARTGVPADEIEDHIGGYGVGDIDASQFAAGIEPVSIVSTLPNPVGYTGPLTVFLTTDEKLYRYDSAVPEFTTYVDSDDLVANSVIAGKIAAGAINAQALFVDGIITANKLQIRDFNNMLENPAFRGDGTGGLDGWYYNSAPYITVVASGSTPDSANCPAEFAAEIPVRDDWSSWLTQPDMADPDAMFECAPGEIFYYEGWVCNDGTANGDIFIGFRFFDRTGGAYTAAVDVHTPAGIGGTWTPVAGFKTVPADRYLGVWFFSGDNIVTPLGNWYLTKVKVHRASGVTIEDGAITALKIEAGAIEAGHISAGSIEAGALAVGAVNAANLIVSGIIATSHMTANTIDGDRILAASIAAEKIVANSITATQIKANAVDTAELNANAVTAAKIDALAVEAGHLAVGAIDAGNIIVNGIIVTNHMVSGTINANRLTAGSISVTEMGALSVDTAELVAGAVTAAKIEADAIDSQHINVGAINAGNMIASGTIITSHMSANTIDGDRISAGTLAAAKIEANSIDSGQIKAGAIKAGEIDTNAVTAAKILAGEIATSHMSANSIDGDRIAAGTLAAAKIEAGTITATQITGSALSAIYADLGTITAGSISAVTGSFAGDLSADSVDVGSGSYTQMGLSQAASGSQIRMETEAGPSEYIEIRVSSPGTEAAMTIRDDVNRILLYLSDNNCTFGEGRVRWDGSTIIIRPDGVNDALKCDGTENVHVGAGSTSSSRTTSMLFIPQTSGVPSGAPSSTGRNAICVDEGNDRLYVRTAAGWKYAALV